MAAYKRRKKPEGGWTLHVALNLDADDADALASCAKPGEPAAHTYLRLARENVMPHTIKLRYRKAPLFPDWMEVGPMSPITAVDRGEHLLRRGFEVETVQVAGVIKKYCPLEDEEVPEHCDECGAELNEQGNCPTPDEH